MTIAQRLAEASQKTGMTQAAFAKQLKVTRSAVHQWESGATKYVRPEHLFAVADATGFSARWLATGKGPRNAPARPEEAFSTEVLSLAAQIAGLPKERRELLMALLRQPIPDERLDPAWVAPRR